MGNKIELAIWNGDVDKLQIYANNTTNKNLYTHHYHSPGVFGAHVQHILVFRKHSDDRLYWILAHFLNMPEDVNATFSQGFTASNLAEAGRDPDTIMWWKMHLYIISDRDLFRVAVESETLLQINSSMSRFARLQSFRNIGKGIDSLISSSSFNGPLYTDAPEHLTPLYFAVIANNVGVLKELLARGARAYPHPRTPEGNYSLLHAAARMDHASMIPLLVQAGCCVNEDAFPNSGKFRTPFVIAAHYGNLRSLKVLMETPSFVLTPEQGYCSLASAAQNGQIHLLSILMKLCCKLLGTSPLFFYDTHFQSSRDIVDYKDSVSVLHLAANCNQHGALRTLIRCYKQFIGGDFPRIGTNLMNNAVQSGSADTVAVLFEEGLVDLSSEDPCGSNNPLRTAVHHLEMGVLRVLMSSRCASFIPVTFSKGLLHYALEIRAIRRKAFLSSRDSAILHNHIPLSFVAGLLNIGCNIRSVDGEHGFLPIHTASMLNDPKAVQLLIDYGCPPNAFTQSSSGYRLSTMHIASEHDSSDVIEVLVANGCNVDFHHPLEDPPLYVAIDCGSLNAVETLLRLGASTSSRWADRIRSCLPSPIHMAIAKAQLTAIDCLVKYGANVSEFKSHPEHAAHMSLLGEISNNLIKAGATLNPDTHLPERSSRSDIPFDMIYKYFASLGAYQCIAPPLFLALFEPRGFPEQRIAVIEKLVSCGADINRQYEYADISMFGLACRHGLYEEVKCLIDLGADLEVGTNSGRCPIHLAVTHNHLDVVKLLLDSGCSANSPIMFYGKPDLTPFQLACIMRCPGILKALAVKVTDINQMTIDKLSPFHLALVHPNVLFDNDPSDVSKACGPAPITLPLERENETIRTLLDLKCDVNAQDDEGVTPLDYAIHYHLKKVVFWLTNAGALKGIKITDREELRRHIDSVEGRLARVTAKFDDVETNLQAMTDSYSHPKSRSHNLDIETHAVESTLRNAYTDFIKHAEAREMASTLKKQGLIPASVEAKIKEATDVPTSNGHLYDHLFTQATPSTLDILCRVLKAQVGRPATSQLGGRMHAELNDMHRCIQLLTVLVTRP